jgi:hypothetical protein
MTISNSITNAVVAMIIVIVIVGTVLGLALSRNDLLNPTTSAAEQRRTDVETAHLAQVYWLAEQMQAEANELELEHQRQKRDLERAFLSIRNSVLIGAAAVAMVVVAIGVSILLVKLGNRWSVQAQRPAAAIPGPIEEVWKVRAYRDARIEMARDRERRLRKAVSQERAGQARPVAADNGRSEEPVPDWVL